MDRDADREGSTCVAEQNKTKKWLLGSTLAELRAITDSHSLPPFTAKQIAG